MKIGILKEEKIPRDSRVTLTPSQCRTLMEECPEIKVVVQPCKYRCYTNEEYVYQGVELNQDLSDCDVLIGVKEVPPNLFIPNKTYFIFSHTIKKQAQNKKLLQSVLKNKVRLIDWETLTDAENKRLIAFGRWAGIVGAYHAVRMIGLFSKQFEIEKMSDVHNFAEAQKEFSKVKLPKLKVVLTGTGRVANGAAFLLDLVEIEKVNPEQFLKQDFDHIVYTQLDSKHMYRSKVDGGFDAAHYHSNPALYESRFEPFTQAADVLINGIYWDERIPKFFTKEEMRSSNFRIKLIADITCDVAPDASIPSTVRSSTIEDSYYGYNPKTEQIEEAFTTDAVQVMAIDNLPNELPRDASEDFGNTFMSRILPELTKEQSAVLDRATIARDGKLTERYLYLSDYAEV